MKRNTLQKPEKSKSDVICPEQKGQKGQLNKKENAVSPKNTQLAVQKNKFIQALRSNGGNVSKALDVPGLIRNIAYSHFKEDSEFANAWLAARNNG